MSFLDQLRMKKALEERGRKEVEAKLEAEDLISRVRASVDASHSIGVDVSGSRSILELAEQQMVERDYRKALETSRKALEAVEAESQERIMQRFMHLRNILRISMVPEPQELEQFLQEGELAIALSLPRAVEISKRAYPLIHDHLLHSKGLLLEKVRDLFPEHLQEERLALPLEELMGNEGDAESLHASMTRVADAVREIIQEKMDWLRGYHDKLAQFVGEMGYTDLVWKELRAHFKEDDFETVKKEMDLIHDSLDSQLEVGLPSAFRKAQSRLSVLNDLSVDTGNLADALLLAEKKIPHDPLSSLDEYVEVMNRIQDLESDYIADMIQEIRDMITVGRHIGVDLGDVIIGLDEVRTKLRNGDLLAAVEGVEKVKALLLERMDGYNELELAFFTLADLVKEVEEYDLHLEEPMEMVNRAREDMSESGLEGPLALVREAINMIHAQARELLGSKLILAQKSLQAGFHIEADVIEESERLGKLFQDVSEGRYRGLMRDITDCRLRIEGKLKAHAKNHLQSFLREVEEREGIYDVKKMRLQAKGAEKLLNENLADESYRIIWTARRQLYNLDVDALEGKLRKVRELVSTGEAVNVDVSDLKRIMFSFSHDGKNVNMEAITKASELMERVRERLYHNLLQQLHDLHVLAYQAKMSGYQTDEQLATLKKAFRVLEKGEYRAAYGALKEAEIGFNIQVLVHDEVYERLLRISSIVAQEGLSDKPLKTCADLFQNGRYREADVESKKLLRSLIEQGLKSAAANIMEDGSMLIETADMLRLKVVTLKESMPQAMFFLENGDYRHASSLMEKAMRTGRSEISKALQERSTNLRPRIGEPMLDVNEKAVSLDMLENAWSNIEAGRYEVATNIIFHLEEDLDKRAMLVNRCRIAQVQAQDFIGLGRMMGLEVHPLMAIAEQSELMLRQGRPLLCHEFLERAIEQIAEKINFQVREQELDAIEDAESRNLAGPEMEWLLRRLEEMRGEVRNRDFYAAKDSKRFIEAGLEELQFRRQALEASLHGLGELCLVMSKEGMDTAVLERSLQEIESCLGRGEFLAGASKAYHARLDFQSALELHRDLKVRASRLSQHINAMPPGWQCPETFDSIELALKATSAHDMEGSYRSFLVMERSFYQEREARRLHVRRSLLDGFQQLREEVPEGLAGMDDQALQSLWSGLESRLQDFIEGRASQLEKAAAASSMPNVMSRRRIEEARGALQRGSFLEAEELLAQGALALGRDDASGARVVREHKELRQKVSELQEMGADVRQWVDLILRPPADRLGIDRRMNIVSLKVEAERESLLPRLDAEYVDGLLVVRNHGPGIAQDIHVGGKSIGYLGVGQSKSFPWDRGSANEICYKPLGDQRQRRERIKV